MIATYKLLTNQLKIKGEQLFSMGNVTISINYKVNYKV